MAKIRLFLALKIGKLLHTLLRLTGRGGGALPGLIALRIAPTMVDQLCAELPEGVVVITGTNGKTTSAAMLRSVLIASGKRVVQNEAGSNLLRGVASTLIVHSTLFGRVKADIGVFEIDEATMPALLRQVKPRAIVVTNLFRDQLDRYGELYSTAALIDAALKESPQSELILNGDDPLVAQLGAGHAKRHFWGITDPTLPQPDRYEPMDSIDCPICGKPLEYSSRTYAHLGDYRCPDGHIARPKLDVEATKLELRGLRGTTLALKGNERFHMPLAGLYNASNALGILLCSNILGIDRQTALKGLESVSAAFGRAEPLAIANRRVWVLLIKNPTGLSQVIDLITQQSKSPHLLIALNDNFADGTDVSWIWDAAVERLAALNAKVTVSGTRAYDLQLRLKYAGLPASHVKVANGLDEAFKLALSHTPSTDELFVLPTYTALLDLRRDFAKQGYVKHYLETSV